GLGVLQHHVPNGFVGSPRGALSRQRAAAAGRHQTPPRRSLRADRPGPRTRVPDPRPRASPGRRAAREHRAKASVRSVMRAATRRSRTLPLLLLIVVAALVALGCVYSGYLANMLPTAAAELNELTLPPGFRIAVYAADVPNARQMALGPPGVVFVGSRSEGKVYAVVDREGGARTVHVVAGRLDQPSGVAFRDGALYVAAVSRILRFRDVAKDLAHPPKPEVVTDAYPSDAHHGWKFIAFGPDGRLYVPVGAPCNICTPPGPLHATITRIDLAGGRPEVVARGVR